MKMSESESDGGSATTGVSVIARIADPKGPQLLSEPRVLFSGERVRPTPGFTLIASDRSQEPAVAAGFRFNERL